MKSGLAIKVAESEQANKVREAIKILLDKAQNDGSLNEPFTGELKKKGEGFIKPNTEVASKTLTGFQTETFLDGLFLDGESKSINGIPNASNVLLTGLPNSGKTLLITEMALRIASRGKKTAFISTEDIFRADSTRYDLESRMREKAKILNLDWKTISENLFVIDVVANAELRDFTTFVQTYRALVETEKVEVVLMDSITQLEDTRGAIKYRLLELCRYNQKHGITAFFVAQRAIEETDGFAISGGLGLSHIVDIVMELDYKKLSSWDSAIKQDISAKQGEIAYFFRVLKCRICKFDAHYFSYQVNNDGLITFSPRIVK